ncbi:stAR-related lipid transfer protein 5 isoform X1 [Sapajus apella]|uniref:StAR-related lipid transfer protein 5 isoform X1 n=1 Tax=Sapajus apella TaxID=9515 RepID=A0A6J3GR55_SAPAP|nr:stAR-related lipid transfer protein 5 isoform X1 [Sapajus apella]
MGLPPKIFKSILQPCDHLSSRSLTVSNEITSSKAYSCGNLTSISEGQKGGGANKFQSLPCKPVLKSSDRLLVLTCNPNINKFIDALGCNSFLCSRYRGEGIVFGTPEEVWDCVKPAVGGLRVKWDENVNGFEIIESITDTLCVSRTSTPSAAMKLISPRDFVDLVLIKRYEDGTISSNASHVEHPLCPPKPGFVRGFNHPCGCFCEPLPG